MVGGWWVAWRGEEDPEVGPEGEDGEQVDDDSRGLAVLAGCAEGDELQVGEAGEDERDEEVVLDEVGGLLHGSRWEIIF